jgi:DNA-binding NtrC family response regulator
MYRVLVVDDDEQMRMALCKTLQHIDFKTKSAKNAQEALNILEDEVFDVIVSDLKMPKMDGIEFLDKAKKLTDAPIIMITAFGTIENAVEAMKLGAFDFILKPFSVDVLKKVVDLAISHKSASQNTNGKKDALNDNFIIHSQKMQDIVNLSYKVAQTDATVLLLGDSGTGKEMLAKYIHLSSKRSKQKFVAINCAAIPSNLLESELFGYEKGAFSGATKTYQGKFEQAHKGTLLLDEITEMPLELQAKILRILQERKVDRLGSKDSIDIDVRIICTTNKIIEDEVKMGNFREDLYYRINVFPIKIPPLSHRRDDIEPLVQFFLKKYTTTFNKEIDSISPDALDILNKYNWPGNVRELENVIERAVVLCEDNIIKKDDIFLHNI